MNFTALNSFFSYLADAVEDWMVASGFLDQLSFLMTKTALARRLILMAASGMGLNSFIEGAIGQALVAAAVAVLIGSVDAFITYVRRKHGAAVQLALGVDVVDSFVGRKTVAAAVQIAKDAQPPNYSHT